MTVSFVLNGLAGSLPWTSNHCYNIQSTKVISVKRAYPLSLVQFHDVRVSLHEYGPILINSPMCTSLDNIA